MKRCPQCYEAHDDSERFCEADGHELLPDPTLSPQPQTVVPQVSQTKSVWWPAAGLGVLVGLVIGVGIFAVSFRSGSEMNEPHAVGQAPEIPQKTLPNRAAVNPAPTPEPEASPSPESEQEAEAEPSPAVNPDQKTVSVQLNQGPISTGQKIKSGEGEGGVQTVIEMNDGSTLDVDAAWEDKQGIWYRRSGLVSFVESSRVKAITARRATKLAEVPDR